MKRCLSLLFVIVVSFLVLLPFSTKALENNIYANTESKVEGAIKVKLKSGSTSVSLNNYNATFISTKKTDENDVVIIPSSLETLNWIGRNLSTYNIQNAYRISFYSNGQKAMPAGKITMHIMGTVGKNLIFLDSNGNKINTSESYIDITNNDGYIVIATKKSTDSSTSNNIQNTVNDNKIYIDCDKNGAVALEGIIYRGTEQISINQDKVKLAIIPNQNYEIDKVLVNNNDQTSFVNGGFIFVGKGDSIKVLFKKESSYEMFTYTLSGILTKDNKPLKNAKVVLHSKEITTITNSKGYYEFKNVPSGHHTISVYNGKNLIGYKEFYIKTGNETTIGAMGTIKISSLAKNVILDMNIKDYEIDFISIEENQANAIANESLNDQDNAQVSENDRVLVVLLLIIVIILLLLIIIRLKKKYKKNTKKTLVTSEDLIEVLKL